MNHTPDLSPSSHVPAQLPDEDSDQLQNQQDAAQAGPQEAQKSRLPDIPVSQVRHVKTQAELDEVLESHRQWIAQVLDPDVEVAVGRANLAGADLRGFVLAGANLSGANLAKANLAETDLSGANLSAANLTGAVLACAHLGGVKLRGAKLEGADLRGADLTGAHLQGADLSRCLLKSPETTQPQEKEQPLAPMLPLHDTESPSQPDPVPLEAHFTTAEA